MKTDISHESIEFFRQLSAKLAREYKPPFELSAFPPVRLVGFASQSIALAVETVARAIDRPELTDETLRHEALKIALNPTAAALLFVFFSWRNKHRQFQPSLILSAPKFVLTCRSDFDAASMMLARLRPRIPVADSHMALRRDSGSESEANSRSEPRAVAAFFKTLDATLRRTSKRKRKLIGRVGEGSRETADQDWDWRATAIVGALERYQDGMKSLRPELLKGGPFVALPSIPVPGMEDRNPHPDGRDWAAFGTDIFVTFLAGLAPIFMGVLELSLTNAAEAAQHAELDRRAAQKRGGTVKVVSLENEHDRDGDYGDGLESEMLDPATLAPLKVETAEDIRSDQEFTERITESFPEAAARYFLARMNLDLDQKHAAKAAGIDPRTAREYERRYEKELRSLIDGQFPRKSR